MSEPKYSHALTAAEWRHIADQHRRAWIAWQEWARRLCHEIGAHPEGGELGDGPAREAIAKRVRQFPEDKRP